MKYQFILFSSSAAPWTLLVFPCTTTSAQARTPSLGVNSKPKTLQPVSRTRHLELWCIASPIWPDRDCCTASWAFSYITWSAMCLISSSGFRDNRWGNYAGEKKLSVMKELESKLCSAIFKSFEWLIREHLCTELISSKKDSLTLILFIGRNYYYYYYYESPVREFNTQYTSIIN